ncbi:ABC transporter substrate-binding protein [Sulfurimonas sp.]
MRYILFFLLNSLVLFAAGYLPSELKRVSLQLAWLNQFQFAGYYVAKEKGYYRNVGLDVKLKEYRPYMSVYNEVVAGKSDFGVGRSSLVRYDSAGKKVVMLGAIFQSSPDIVLALEDSGIKSVEEFKGKTLMKTKEAIDNASINAMLKSHNLDVSDLNYVEHSFNIHDLIDKNIDLYAAYISNEPYTLDKMGIKYKIFSPKDDGFNFYSDILFTSRRYLEKNHEIVKSFKEASLRGWEYAFSHIDETISIILQKYNTQNKTKEALLYEANALKKLAYKDNSKLGDIQESQIQRTYDIYKILGLTKEKLQLKNLIHDEHKTYFTPKEREYIKTRGVVKFCTQPDALPYSAIKDGKFIGLGFGIMNMLRRDSGLEFELVTTKTLKESLQKAKAKECDMIPIMQETDSRKKIFHLTSPYYEEPLVITAKKDENYILNIESVLNKTFAVRQSTSFVEKLKKHYPKIKLVEVPTVAEGFNCVKSGRCFAYIDVLMSSAYYMQHNEIVGFKIVGQLDESVKVRMAIRDDDAMLFNIVNKTVKNISKKDIQHILNSWISVNYTKAINIFYLKEIVVAVFLFVLFMLYREYFLKKKNVKLQELQKELMELNKTLEQKVYEATKDLQKAQEIAKLGSWVCEEDRDGNRRLRWSKETYDICEIEYTLQNGINAKFLTKVHPDDVEKVKEFYAKSLRNKDKSFIRHKLLMDDGRVKFVDEHSETFYDENGMRTSYGTIQDVTQEVLLKQEMMKKDAFIIHQSRLAQMGEMMSMIAHQWKQPLSAIGATQMTISTVIELEKYDLSDEKQRKDFLNFLQTRLDKIALYVQNLSEIIRDFRDFYKPKKESAYLAIDTIVKKAYELVLDTYEAAKIEIELDLNSLSTIKVHENELMQVVLNIVNNAKEQLVQNNVVQAKIKISSYESKEEIFITIEDNAGGIDEEIVDKIFDPYFSTKLEKHGTGLGLYMSKIIVEEYHNGNISVQNIQDGAKFIIKLKKVVKTDEQNN